MSADSKQLFKIKYTFSEADIKQLFWDTLIFFPSNTKRNTFISNSGIFIIFILIVLPPFWQISTALGVSSLNQGIIILLFIGFVASFVYRRYHSYLKSSRLLMNKEVELQLFNDKIVIIADKGENKSTLAPDWITDITQNKHFVFITLANHIRYVIPNRFLNPKQQEQLLSFHLPAYEYIQI